MLGNDIGFGVFGYSKVRHSSLAKNINWLPLMADFPSVVIGEKYPVA